MTVTVLEEAQVTHLLTYHIDADTLEEAKELILGGTVDYREREWLLEDDHRFDKDSFEEKK